MSAAAVLQAEGVTLRYGALTALDGVTFSVGDGELLAVIGPNGAGKTTLFDVLCCMVQPQSGRIRLHGNDLAGRRTHQLAGLGVARTLQNPGLFAGLDALDNVLVGRHHLMRGSAVRSDRRRTQRSHVDAAMAALDACGVAHHARRRPSEMPYGVQKRVELARAIAQEPSVLLLDEPLAGLEAGERADVLGLLLRLRAEGALTMVLVEHDMGAVMRVADSVLVLDFGRVIALGPPAAVQDDERVVRAYLGVPAAGAGA